MSVPLPTVSKGPHVSVSMPIRTKGPPMAVPVPSGSKGTRVTHCQLTSLPYDSLYLRFRPSPPRDKPASPLYGWVPFVGSSTTLTAPVSSCQEAYGEGKGVRSSPHLSDCHGVTTDGHRRGRDDLSHGQQAVRGPDLHSNSTRPLVKNCADGQGKGAGQEEGQGAMTPVIWTHRHHHHTHTTLITTSSSASAISSPSSTTKCARASSGGCDGSRGGSGPVVYPLCRSSNALSDQSSTGSLTCSEAVPTMGPSAGAPTSKQADPLYSDPVSGAPLLFQHRLQQMAALQADTVREERGKKARRKVLGNGNA